MLSELVSNTAPVAQRIEHLTTDQKVGGSNPSGRTIKTDPLEGSFLLVACCVHSNRGSLGSRFSRRIASRRGPSGRRFG